MALEKAYFQELELVGKDLKDKAGAPKINVQFNPESLKVNFSNQIQKPQSAGDQSGPAALQYVGSGTTKMSAQLWFDTSILDSSASAQKGDVRVLTKKVADFMSTVPIKSGEGKGLFTPRFVKFNWGTFQFQGIMDSFEESVEFFSSDGVPQRASASFSLLMQAITFLFGQQANQSPGSVPLTAAPQGSSLQSMAAAAGRPDWQSIASANGIENPRMLGTGQLIDMNADVTGGISVGIGAGSLGSVSVGASATAGGGTGASTSASAAAGFNLR